MLEEGAKRMAAAGGDVKGFEGKLIPVDSEHNALFQALPDCFPVSLDEAGVRELVLTASGGP